MTGCKRTDSLSNKPVPTNKVEIKEVNGTYRFYRNNQPFFVQGAVGYQHLQEFVQCGGNTISTWDTTNLQSILDEAQQHKLAVIVGLDIADGDSTKMYGDKAKLTSIVNAFQHIISKYKDHPALFAWCLGNELFFPYTPTYYAYYNAFNKLAEMIHTTDPNHPVTTSLANFKRRPLINIKLKVDGIDFISINTYNKLKTLPQELEDFKWFWDGPYLITEWAPNGGWEVEKTKWESPIENTSTKKAAEVSRFYKEYMPLKDPRFLGSLFFYWGNRQEYTHTWFSVFNEDEKPTEVMEALKDCWNNTTSVHQSPQIRFSLIDGLGAFDNIMVPPGGKHVANLQLANNTQDSLHYKWELLKEDWWGWENKRFNLKKPEAEAGFFSDSTKQSCSFTAPLKEGPYRLFVTVYNNKGYCTTSNTPFYVVTP